MRFYGEWYLCIDIGLSYYSINIYVIIVVMLRTHVLQAIKGDGGMEKQELFSKVKEIYINNKVVYQEIPICTQNEEISSCKNLIALALELDWECDIKCKDT